METRRFILALSLSLIVFVLYMRFFAPPPPKPVAPPVKAAQELAKDQPVATNPVLSGAAAAKIAPAVKGRDIIVETDLVKATVNTAGGVITGWELKHYREGGQGPGRPRRPMEEAHGIGAESY